MNATRIRHAAQAGTRLKPTDSLFETVASAIFPIETPQVGEATDSDWSAWLETVPAGLDA